MNPATLETAVALARESDVRGLIIAPPLVYLEEIAKNLRYAELGSQDVFWAEKGPYTGEVSAGELKALGVKYVIIGHSERRRNLGETDEMIAKKIKAAVDAKLIPILCVGESAEERAAGKTEEVVGRELRIGLSLIPSACLPVGGASGLIVAYEPIWAIGSGAPDTPQDMINMVKYIKKIAGELSVIYGGSVTSENAGEFLKNKEINGVLVGGASLISEEIKKIVAISNNKN